MRGNVLRWAPGPTRVVVSCGGLPGPREVTCCGGRASPSVLNVCWGRRPAQCEVTYCGGLSGPRGVKCCTRRGASPSGLNEPDARLHAATGSRDHARLRATAIGIHRAG